MKWKVAFLLLLTTEVVFSAPTFVEETLMFLKVFGECFARCYTQFTWSEQLCVDVDGRQLTLGNKAYNCMKAKCYGCDIIQYLYMGSCGRPIPTTGHISTEPKIPSPY